MHAGAFTEGLCRPIKHLPANAVGASQVCVSKFHSTGLPLSRRGATYSRCRFLAPWERWRNNADRAAMKIFQNWRVRPISSWKHAARHWKPFTIEVDRTRRRGKTECTRFHAIGDNSLHGREFHPLSHGVPRFVAHDVVTNRRMGSQRHDMTASRWLIAFRYSPYVSQFHGTPALRLSSA